MAKVIVRRQDQTDHEGVATESGPAPTFTTYQVTPTDDPVQVGCIAMRSGVIECRNLLDFIDTGAAPDGRFYAAYTEGCTKGCAENPHAMPSDSRDIQTALASIDGWSLQAP